jgi:hypothetical protein
LILALLLVPFRYASVSLLRNAGNVIPLKRTAAVTLVAVSEDPQPGLGKIPVTQVVMTPFNGTILAEPSVAKAITGKIRISGRSPVTVPGRYGRGEGIVVEVQGNGN